MAVASPHYWSWPLLNCDATQRSREEAKPFLYCSVPSGAGRRGHLRRIKALHLWAVVHVLINLPINETFLASRANSDTKSVQDFDVKLGAVLAVVAGDFRQHAGGMPRYRSQPPVDANAQHQSRILVLSNASRSSRRMQGRLATRPSVKNAQTRLLLKYTCSGRLRLTHQCIDYVRATASLSGLCFVLSARRSAIHLSDSVDSP